MRRERNAGCPPVRITRRDAQFRKAARGSQNAHGEEVRDEEERPKRIAALLVFGVKRLLVISAARRVFKVGRDILNLFILAAVAPLRLLRLIPGRIRRGGLVAKFRLDRLGEPRLPRLLLLLLCLRDC